MEIVARAYDSDKKIIIENVQETEHGGFFTSVGGYLKDPRFVVMLWSGMVDKEGQKIFEGDILEVDSLTALAIDSTRVRVLVGIKDGCFMYSSGSDRNTLNTLLYPIVSKCKVIGNKYLNEPALWSLAIIKKPRKYKKRKTKKNDKTRKKK